MRIHALVFATLSAILSASPAIGEDETTYFAVLLEGKKAGTGLLRRQVASGLVTTTEMQTITLGRMGTNITITVTAKTVETVEGKPLAFEVSQDMGMGPMTTKGTVDREGKLKLTTTGAGKVQRLTLDWPEGAVLNEGVRLGLLKTHLKPGATYTARMFNPLLQYTVETKFTIGAKRKVDLLGRVVELTEITSVSAGPMGRIVGTDYVDKDLRRLKSITPMLGMNLELIACSKEVALAKADVADFFDRLILASPAPLGDLASAKAITYLLKPTNPQFNVPETDNQKVRKTADGAVEVVVRPAVPLKGAAFPYKGKDERLLEALEPNRYLDSDDKRVAALAARAVGDATDAAVAAKRIEEFVRKYVMEKNLSVGYATASEVAAGRQGDCTEHAVLTAAMCRASGIPAEVVAGVVYISSFGVRKDVFAPHAWARANVGGRWIGLDAAMKGYDAGHIALAIGNGEPKSFFAMIPALGYFTIEKVTVVK